MPLPRLGLQVPTPSEVAKCVHWPWEREGRRELALPGGIQGKDSKASYQPDGRQLPHSLSLLAVPQLRFWQIIAYGLSLPVRYIYTKEASRTAQSIVRATSPRQFTFRFQMN